MLVSLSAAIAFQLGYQAPFAQKVYKFDIAKVSIHAIAEPDPKTNVADFNLRIWLVGLPSTGILSSDLKISILQTEGMKNLNPIDVSRNVSEVVAPDELLLTRGRPMTLTIPLCTERAYSVLLYDASTSVLLAEGNFYTKTTAK